MPRNLVDFKFYGQLSGLDESLALRLAGLLPDGSAVLKNSKLELEYEGFEVLLDDFLEALSSLPEGAIGHLDVIDYETSRVSRHEFSGPRQVCESFGFDDILEHTKNEGNI